MACFHLRSRRSLPAAPFVFQFFAVLFTALHDLDEAEATDIRWTPGSGSRDEAATAPKSQKYWDENNIERPDYAKTDAEIAAERGSSSLGLVAFYLVVLFAVCVVLFYAMDQWRLKYGHGNRLGVSGQDQQSPFMAWLSKLASSIPTTATATATSRSSEAERNARLSRFDQSTRAGGPSEGAAKQQHGLKED
mmetsp:Transcript_9838/g.26851  ORF Transcript_9838/g.26851 Transcript_9838/m.26851 type:complete len:192 (-) Transcript_9838:1148-1723(-)